jgi:YD repeat-containing protein
MGLAQHLVVRRIKQAKNTNRTSLSDNGVTTATYCYNSQDRLLSTTDSRYNNSAITYDDHGNNTVFDGDTISYDAADRTIMETLGVLDDRNNPESLHACSAGRSLMLPTGWIKP